MPLDLQTFKPRFFSALVFGAIMLLALLGHPFIYIAVFSFITFIGSKELYNIIQLINKKTVTETTQLIYALSACALFLFVAHSNAYNFIENINMQPLVYLVCLYYFFYLLLQCMV